MMHTHSIVTRTFRKSWEGCEPPTEDERLAEFKWKWYAHGHHHDVENEDSEGNADHEPA